MLCWRIDKGEADYWKLGGEEKSDRACLQRLNDQSLTCDKNHRSLGVYMMGMMVGTLIQVKSRGACRLFGGSFFDFRSSSFPLNLAFL